MAVENHPVHDKVRHGKVKYGCWNKSREQREYHVPVRLYDANGSFIGHGTEIIKPWASPLCRHTGEYSKDENGTYSWKEDANCEGCNPINKDHAYITRMRRLVEQEVRALQLHI